MNRNPLIVVSFLFLLLFSGCKDEPLLLSDVITITSVSTSPQPANGINEFELLVHIGTDSDRDKRTVTVTTDVGTFSNKLATITVTVDQNGNGKVYLKSNSTGTATVKATVLTFSATTQVSFSYPSGISFENAAIESLTADNNTTLKITAQIDPLTPTDKREVVFTTDIGTFTNNTNTISVVAIEGKAVAYLKANTTGTANIKAVNLSFSVAKMVTLTSSGAVNFENAATESLVADGFSLLKISAHIDPNVDPAKRFISLKTDLGTFSNNEKTVILPIDAAGNAFTYLKGTIIGTATIVATGSLTATANKTVIFTQPMPDDVFKIDSFTDNIPSDGVSTIAIPVSINKNLATADKKATFTSTAGTFQVSNPVTINADSEGKLTGYLKHNTPGPVYVTVTCGSITRNLTVNFTKANPDLMLLTGNSSLSHGLNNTLALTINLKRSIGNPNPDFLFDYKAVDVSGNQIGIFSNGSASNVGGTATVSFTAGETDYRGIVLITVSLKSNPAIKATHQVIIF
ncbi:hypothetical protein SAMN05421820_11538 [Pedobacter steynii]|uniref:Big-1 domain-containing protein n=1 Tax=Pedobacter steynii TaxID=430522 RepID=A0A1H0JQC3_9SPHI|nr:hypothetical protein [Pedobacter steynii]NQX43129.1 hypothetical protein [Pedobacter steynii]SDO45712.1 hypothetical protein SAMN05421820_11538 [Pedobacter steynii]